MKKIFFIILIAMIFVSAASGENETKKTALVIIDVQDFYFPGGAWELVNPEAAGLNAKKLLEHFRKQKQLVVHVRHNAKKGADIHKLVTPLKGEKVISKDEVNSFNGTDLLKYLKDHGVARLVICGMQTHMCVEAAVRAGYDHGFKCVLVHDACATRALKFKDKTVAAEDVHASTLSTLASYAKVIDTEAFIKKK